MVARLALRSWAKSAMLTGLLLLLFFSYGQVFRFTST